MNASDPELADLTPFKTDYDDGEALNALPWTSRADLRMAFNAESNHDVQKQVVAALAENLPGLLKRVEFDSEYSCFYVYGKTEEDCQDVCGVIFALVSQIPS